MTDLETRRFPMKNSSAWQVWSLEYRILKRNRHPTSLSSLITSSTAQSFKVDRALPFLVRSLYYLLTSFNFRLRTRHNLLLCHPQDFISPQRSACKLQQQDGHQRIVRKALKVHKIDFARPRYQPEPMCDSI